MKRSIALQKEVVLDVINLMRTWWYMFVRWIEIIGKIVSIIILVDIGLRVKDTTGTGSTKR